MPGPMKITNENATREVFAYLVFLGVFWGLMYSIWEVESLLELHDQAWITSWTRRSFHYVVLIVAVTIANRIGSISYLGLSLVALFGVYGLMQVLFFRDYRYIADSINFSPWYTYIYALALVSLVLYLVRHITSDCDPASSI